MGSSFIHLIRTDSNEFFLMAEQYSMVNMYHSFLIHSSADKSSLNIWNFFVHVLLKPENFEHYFTSMWDEYNCTVVWTFLGIAFLLDWNENWPFPVRVHCWVFPVCWHIECSTFTASSFRIWNSSTGIPSPPLALFIVMHPKARLTSHSKMSGCTQYPIPLGQVLALKSNHCHHCWHVLSSYCVQPLH